MNRFLFPEAISYYTYFISKDLLYYTFGDYFFLNFRRHYITSFLRKTVFFSWIASVGVGTWANVSFRKVRRLINAPVTVTSKAAVKRIKKIMHAFSLHKLISRTPSTTPSQRDKLTPFSHLDQQYYAEGWVSSGLTFVNFAMPLSLSALYSNSLSLKGY